MLAFLLLEVTDAELFPHVLECVQDMGMTSGLDSTAACPDQSDPETGIANSTHSHHSQALVCRLALVLAPQIGGLEIEAPLCWGSKPHNLSPALSISLSISHTHTHTLIKTRDINPGSSLNI